MHKKKLNMLSAVAIAYLSAAPLALAVEWNHDPDSAIGPYHWGDLDPGFVTCELGNHQSPVNIDDAIPGGGPALLAEYHDIPLEVENIGHTIEVPYALPGEPTSLLRIGGDLYQLLQFHFHAPSEHEVDGQLADMELHLVHRNVATGQLAVVGVLLVEGRDPNPVIEAIFDYAPDEEGVVAVEELAINAKQLLPGYLDDRRNARAPYELNSYWSYSGSLTTPPCSEGVSWYVLHEPVEVSAATIDRMHELNSLFPAYDGYPDNNRPVLPVNDRVIIDRGPYQRGAERRGHD